jgi:hypothetical protein
MTLSLHHVALQHVHQTWPLVEHFIARAQEHGGDDYTLDQIKMFVAQGQWVLVVAVDEEGKLHGAATVNFSNYPNDRIAFITFIGGKFIANQEILLQLKSMLQKMGATKIQAAVRPSMAKLLSRTGFKERYTIVETKI